MKNEKLQTLLRLVIDNYIGKGDPIGSKFLNSLDDIKYAPSTLRKYLNILEKEGLLYQPYNSAGRIPTAKGLSNYLDEILYQSENNTEEETEMDFDVTYARDDLRGTIEMLGECVDGAAVGFLKEDQYYYLGLNNLLKDTLISDVETTKYLIKFIESKELVQTLDKKMAKRGRIYHTFLQDDNKMITIVYTKFEINGFDSMIAILGPSRVDHRKNIAILKKLIGLSEQLRIEYTEL